MLFSNLLYCGNVNGNLLYPVEIVGRTKQYRRGIMHQSKPGFKVQEHQIKQDFSQFGDKQDFQNKYDKYGQ